MKFHTTALALCLITSSTMISSCATPQNVKNPHAAEMEQVNETKLNGEKTNQAMALLFRWWSVFEAPEDIDSAPWMDGLFTDDVALNMEAIELQGAETITMAFSQLPPDNGRAHDLTRATVAQLAPDLWQIEAEFLYQINNIDGTIQSGHSTYRHEMRETASGDLAFSKMFATVTERINTDLIDPSYLDNRARAAIHQYLGATDNLGSDYSSLKSILMESAEIHGMFDPAKERHNDRGDGVLRGWNEISAWLATRKNKFSDVRHDIVEIDVKVLNEGMYETNTLIAVEAHPHSGEPIRVTLPIKITLKDVSEPYFRIAKIER